jgi:hypothetical protein
MYVLRYIPLWETGNISLSKDLILSVVCLCITYPRITHCTSSCVLVRCQAHSLTHHHRRFVINTVSLVAVIVGIFPIAAVAKAPAHELVKIDNMSRWECAVCSPHSLSHCFAITLCITILLTNCRDNAYAKTIGGTMSRPRRVASSARRTITTHKGS